MTRIRLLSGAFLVLAVTVLGCSGNKHAPARVSGKLTYKGAPLKAGSMHFHTTDGVAYSAQISSDGTYSATDLPEGELVVTVETESINPGKKASAGKDAAKRTQMMGQQKAPAGYPDAPDLSELYTKIPEKYSNPKTSPLSVTLSSGRQVHDINLTD